VRTKGEIVEQRDTGPYPLLKIGEVPVRTLESNGRPSTAEASASDWEHLMQVCFDNREAEIGRFIRRHLGGVAPALAELLASVKDMPSPDAVIDLLQFGKDRFKQSFDERDLPERAAEFLSWGGREVGLTITPTPDGFSPTQDFLRRILASVPRITTYPPWLDTMAAAPENQPQVRQGRWEAFIFYSDLFDALSFELLDPAGRFYERRLLLPDVIARRKQVQPRLVLGEREAITDVAELFVTGLAFASAMNAADEHHMLNWAFRWSGLKDRFVDNWFMIGPSRYIAVEDVSPICRTSFAADTPPTALAPMIAQVMAPMFAMFKGYSEPSTQIDETLAEVIERRSRF
jgi:hypothetical protein